MMAQPAGHIVLCRVSVNDGTACCPQSCFSHLFNLFARLQYTVLMDERVYKSLLGATSRNSLGRTARFLQKQLFYDISQTDACGTKHTDWTVI